jgi:hypothetical protein
LLITNDERKGRSWRHARGTRCTAIFARGGETLPRDERVPRSQTAKTEAHDERPGSFAEGWDTKPRDGFRATVDMAAGGGRGPE